MSSNAYCSPDQVFYHNRSKKAFRNCEGQLRWNLNYKKMRRSWHRFVTLILTGAFKIVQNSKAKLQQSKIVNACMNYTDSSTELFPSITQ